MRTLLDRFLDKITVGDDCWEWQASPSQQYGKIWRDGRYDLAHRVGYEIFEGPIQPGMTLDHLCRNTRCVRPDHLEPVSIKVNILRGTSPSAVNAGKTHCPKGHEYTPENIRKTPHGRSCRACDAAYYIPKGQR